MINKKNKIVLAYSGGLDTSVILHWLIAQGYEVVCFIADIGQQEDFIGLKEKAYALGATAVYVEDLTQEFVEQYVFRALQANARYEGHYLLGTALARPLIAKKQVEIAQKEKCFFLAHGATGKGNDQVRFELMYAALMPMATIIAPWKMASFLEQFKGRPDLIAYAHCHSIPVVSTLEKPYSIDENIFHSSFEGGILENVEEQPPAAIFTHPSVPTASPVLITIHFKCGVPTAVYDVTNKVVASDAVSLLRYLNRLAASYGIGYVDLVENRFVGIKSRGVYGTPGGTLLHAAHQALEVVTLDREVFHLKEFIDIQVGRLIYNGFWGSPEFKFLMAAVTESQQRVEGSITIQLSQGGFIIAKRTSPHSLYNKTVASADKEGGYDQQDAQGFIALHALRLKTYFNSIAKEKI